GSASFWVSSSNRAFARSNASRMVAPSLQDGAEGGDRDLEHVVRGLAGGEPLKLEAGLADPSHPRFVVMSPGESNDLEGDSGDHRDEREPEEAGLPRIGAPQEREHDEAHEDDEEEEARAAARMKTAERSRILGCELLARFEIVDRLVLGTVVHEDALHLPPESHPDDVEEEEREPERTVDHVKGEPLSDAGQIGELERQVEEDEEAEHKGDRHGNAHTEPQRAEARLSPGVLLSYDHRGLGRECERLNADAERFHEHHRAADDGEPEEGVTARDR